jgi:hypothetical protein
MCLSPSLQTVLGSALLMPAQLMFGNSDVKARGSGLPLVALRSLAMQTSIAKRTSNPRLLVRRPAPHSRWQEDALRLFHLPSGLELLSSRSCLSQ